MRKLKPGKTNQEDRNNFIEYWAEYIRETPDEVWKKQQNFLIKGHIETARRAKFLSVKQYLKIKGEPCSR